MTSVFVPNETGHWVDENFMRCNEIIHDFDDRLDLRFIPVENRQNRFEKPYAVVDTVANEVCYTFLESVTPEEVLEKIFLGDNRDGNVLVKLDAHNAAIKAMQLKEEMERYEEIAERALFLVKTQKNYIKHKRADGTIVKLDDQLREI